MRLPRRLVAVTAAIAVAWTALWPLITSARQVATGEVMPLCHQAGMQVDPGTGPEDSRGMPKGPKQHCPLCVMAFYAGTSMPVLAPPPPQLAGIAAREPYCASLPCGIETPLPQGRAPPALS